MENKIAMKVLGVTIREVRNEVCGLMLCDLEEERGLTILVSKTGAQVIAAIVQGITMPRPLPHDLYLTTVRALGGEVSEVFIYGYKDGIYNTQITITGAQGEVIVEARASDAIAIAARLHKNVMVAEEIVREAGIPLKEVKKMRAEEEPPTDEQLLRTMSVSMLKKFMQKFVEEEDYENAAKVKRVIDERTSGSAPVDATEADDV